MGTTLSGPRPTVTSAASSGRVRLSPDGEVMVSVAVTGWGGAPLDHRRRPARLEPPPLASLERDPEAASARSLDQEAERVARRRGAHRAGVVVEGPHDGVAHAEHA